MNPLRSLFRLVPVALNGLDELPEARFEIPFILTGKLTMALNTPIMAPTDTQVVAQNKYFGAVSQTDLTRVSFVDGTRQAMVSVEIHQFVFLQGNGRGKSSLHPKNKPFSICLEAIC